MASKARCAHHWVIQNSNGAKSRGVCKLCGHVRRFRNFHSARPRVTTRTATARSKTA